MNLFASVRKHALKRKLAVGMVILVTMGLVGGGRILALSHTDGHTKVAHCVSQKSSCDVLQQAITVHNLILSATGKTGHQQPRPKKVVRYNRSVEPAPISAIRVYPTPVPTSNPVATPQPTSTVPTGNSSVAVMIEQVFGSYAPGALQVARCESGLNPNAYNAISIGGSHAEGVFQILYPSTWMGTSEAGSSPYNAMANILAAHQIFARDGYSWREWSCAS